MNIGITSYIIYYSTSYNNYMFGKLSISRQLKCSMTKEELFCLVYSKHFFYYFYSVPSKHIISVFYASIDPLQWKLCRFLVCGIWKWIVGVIRERALSLSLKRKFHFPRLLTNALQVNSLFFLLRENRRGSRFLGTFSGS